MRASISESSSESETDIHGALFLSDLLADAFSCFMCVFAATWGQTNNVGVCQSKHIYYPAFANKSNIFGDRKIIYFFFLALIAFR